MSKVKGEIYDQQIHKGCGGALVVLAPRARNILKSIIVACVTCEKTWFTGSFAQRDWESGVQAPDIIDISPDIPQKDIKLLE